MGSRAAGRGLDTALGKAQGQATAMGAKARGAGGMGGGMRGAIGGQATLAKGVESTYGGYADKQTALAGAKGRGLGAVEDQLTKLGQEQGYAGTEYGLAMESAALGGERATYGLEQAAEQDWESGMGTWLQGFKEGGRVPMGDNTMAYFEQALAERREAERAFGGKSDDTLPDKKTFLDVLSEIPDAGGN